MLIYVVLFLAVLLYWMYYSSNVYKKYLKDVPGPPALFFFGNIFYFKSTSTLLDLMMSFVKTYGPIIKVQAPLRVGILISDYKFLEKILNSTTIIKKSKEYRFLNPWLGTGLLTSDGAKWKKHRKMLTPAFHFQILEQFINVFESCGEILVKKLQKEIGKDNINIYDFVTLCTLDVICEATMGVKINAQDNKNLCYVHSVRNMCRIIVERTFGPLENFALTYPLTKNYYIQQRAVTILHKHSNSVINSRRKQLESEESEVKAKRPFLDLLLKATIDGRPLTHEEIREEVDTFMFEGHDTTASAISFALYSLANHPEVQKQVLEEQEALFGNNNTTVTPTYSDLQNMKFLEQVIKETLRLYPSVPFYGRTVTEAVEYNGTIYPPGIELYLFPFAIHRNPEYFEDPETFNPSRFEKADGTLPYAFLPFSAGPRNCIGQKFAMLEMKSTISKIIRQFELLPASPKHTLQLTAESVLKSANGIKIKIESRK